MVVNGVPIVTSSEVRWVDPTFYADANSSSSIVAALGRAELANQDLNYLNPNINILDAYDRKSIELWKSRIQILTS
jgi:hypothetical protein